MTWNDYQRAAARTLIDRPDRAYSDRELMLVWNVIGLAGEGSELLETVLAGVFEEEDISEGGVLRVLDAIGKELGDVLWYAAAVGTKLGVNLDDLVRVAGAPAPPDRCVGVGLRLVWRAGQVSSACGRVADLVKKAVFHQHGIDVDKTANLLSGVLAHAEALCRETGVGLGEVMEGNIAKLLKRYPEGYSAEASKGWQATR